MGPLVRALGGCGCTYLFSMRSHRSGCFVSFFMSLVHFCTYQSTLTSSQQHFLLTSQSAESQTRLQFYLWNVTCVSYLPEEQFCTFWKYSILLLSTFAYASTPGSLLMFLSKYLFSLELYFCTFCTCQRILFNSLNSTPRLAMFRSRVWELPCSAGWRSCWKMLSIRSSR